MSIKITATLRDPGINTTYTRVSQKSVVYKRANKRILEHSTDNTRIQEKQEMEDYSPGLKFVSEELEGAIFSLELELFGNNPQNLVMLQKEISLAEIRKISPSIITGGSDDFYALCVLRTKGLEDVGERTEPNGTITLAQLQSIAKKSDVFPNLGKIFKPDNIDETQLTYLKETWILTHLPDDFPVMSASELQAMISFPQVD